MVSGILCSTLTRNRSSPVHLAQHCHQAPARRPAAALAPGTVRWANAMLDVYYEPFARFDLCRRGVHVATTATKMFTCSYNGVYVTSYGLRTPIYTPFIRAIWRLQRKVSYCFLHVL